MASTGCWNGKARERACGDHKDVSRPQRVTTRLDLVKEKTGCKASASKIVEGKLLRQAVAFHSPLREIHP